MSGHRLVKGHIGYYRNTAVVTAQNHYVAQMAGKSPWQAVDSPTSQRQTTFQLLEKHWLLQSPWRRYFTLGCSNLIINTDHKPLLKIFGDRSLNDIPNSRLRDFKEMTLPFRFRITHIPGLKNIILNVFLRYPVSSAPEDTADKVNAMHIDSNSSWSAWMVRAVPQCATTNSWGNSSQPFNLRTANTFLATFVSSIPQQWQTYQVLDHQRNPHLPNNAIL